MEKVKKQKVKKNKKNKKVLVLLVVILVIAVLLGLGIMGVRKIIIANKYKEYTDKMYEYGYVNLYNNGKATATEKVTGIEAIKVVVGVLKDTNNIDDIYTSNTTTVESEKWYDYSVNTGINKTIAKEDLNKEVGKMDVVMIVTNAVEILLYDEVQGIDLDISGEKLSMYTSDEKEVLKKAVTLGLIENKNSEISNDSVIKGMLNKMVIEISEKYATRYYANVILDNEGNLVRQNVKIVTDKAKLPSNAEKYPYVVDNIDKEVYEIEMKSLTPSEAKTPKEVYDIVGNLYMQTHEIIDGYFDAILNIDFANISNEGFKDLLNPYVVYKIEDKDVKEYVSYVKEHKIKLEGSATPLIPILYYNGEQFVVRTKINFKVISSDTANNLLFGDEGKNVKYTGNEFEIYVDLPMGMTFNSYSMLVKISCMAEKMIKPNDKIVLGNND